MPNPLIQKIQSRHAQIGVIGLGYVGLPLVIAFYKAGFRLAVVDQCFKTVLDVET
jgi:UDP-N-acetyl-D-glucosamine dehydrogenase